MGLEIVSRDSRKALLPSASELGCGLKPQLLGLNCSAGTQGWPKLIKVYCKDTLWEGRHSVCAVGERARKIIYCAEASSSSKPARKQLTGFIHHVIGQVASSSKGLGDKERKTSALEKNELTKVIIFR